MGWTTPKTWAAGRLLATDLNTHVRDNLKSMSEWTPFACTWSSTETAPAIGNGTLTAAYTRAGDVITVDVHLIWGSTTSGGTGNWTFSLPFAAAHIQAMPVALVDSGTAWRAGVASNYTPTAVIVIVSGTTTIAQAGVPHTWAVGDELVITGTYRKA